MKSTRQRVQWRTPLSLRLPKIKRNALQRAASRFPRWLPLALLWRPAGRAPRSPARGEGLPKFNSFATHVHAQVNRFASTVLQQTLGVGRTTAERFYRSIERSMLRLERRERAERVAALPSVQRSHEPGAASPRVAEFTPTAPRQASDGSRGRVPLDLSPSERVGGRRAARSRMPRRPELTTAATPAQAVSSSVRGFSPVAMVGRPRRDESRPSGTEARAKLNPVEFFSSAPELVWRQGSEPKTTDSRGTASQEARIAGDAPMPAASAGRPAAVVHSIAESPVERRPTRLSDLEPSFVDRLADDVIRRVERRTRIERERRGL
jgi:hypothetical protein